MNIHMNCHGFKKKALIFGAKLQHSKSLLIFTNIYSINSFIRPPSYVHKIKKVQENVTSLDQKVVDELEHHHHHDLSTFTIK